MSGPQQKITMEQCQELAASKFWEGMTAREIAGFQLLTDRLCMPFPVFHEAVSAALNRKVFFHEFSENYDGLVAELCEGGPSPTVQEVLDMIPEEKRIVIQGDGSGQEHVAN